MAKYTLKEKFISWFVQFLPPCNVITKQLSDRLEGRLSLKERIVLHIHLWTCVWCTRYGNQIEFIEHAAKLHGHHAESLPEPENKLPDDAKAKLKQMLNRESGD